MHNLLLINESFTNGYRPDSLNLISFISVFSAIFVIISKNPIVSVLFLIGLFLSIACYLLVLGVNFIGLSYLLVYVGAVSILFLFILMLINVRVSELSSNTSNTIPLALVIAIYFNYPVYEILPYNPSALNSYSFNLHMLDFMSYGDNVSYYSYLAASKIDDYMLNGNAQLAFVTSKLWDGSLAESTHITSIGSIMYTSYSIWLIITSIILLLAMVGAIVITIKQTK